MCPCQYGRIGAFLLTGCIYWAWVSWGGLPAMFAGLQAGNIDAIAWAACALLGVGNLWIGIREALSHNDVFYLPSVLWSLGVIALSGWALEHGWVLTGNAWLFHLSRAGWFGWIASEVFNIWLNLRGSIARRRDLAPIVAPIANPRLHREVPQQQAGWLRRRRILLIEDSEGEGIEAQEFLRGLGANHHLGSNTPAPPGFIGHESAPRIVHVPDRNGNLIPVRLPGRAKVRQ